MWKCLSALADETVRRRNRAGNGGSYADERGAEGTSAMLPANAPASTGAFFCSAADARQGVKRACRNHGGLHTRAPPQERATARLCVCREVRHGPHVLRRLHACRGEGRRRGTHSCTHTLRICTIRAHIPLTYTVHARTLPARILCAHTPPTRALRTLPLAAQPSHMQPSGPNASCARPHAV